MRALLIAAVSCVVLVACSDRGPQGPAGEAGAQGAQGVPGPTGPTGPQGPAGEVIVLDGGTLMGPQGPRGESLKVIPLAPGQACATGGVRLDYEDGGVAAVVCNGVTGATGATGAQGLPGPQGPQGIQGAAGPQGPAGLSVVSTPLNYGDATCPYGGTRFVVGTTTTYACNGAPGGVGPPGAPGGGGDGGYLSTAPGAPQSYSFAGFTVAAYAGNLGGIVGANAKCHAEFPNSYLCTYREYQWTGSASGAPAGGAWVDDYANSNGYNNFPRDRSSSYTCSSWTSASGYGSFVNPNGLYDYLSTACTTPRPLTCCRSALAVFRGFTSATYAGDLGGPLGAHAKCQAEFSGSHLCTYREYQWAGSPSAVPAGGAWVDDYASSNGYNHFPRDRGASYTCSSWTSSASGYGSFVNTNGHYDYLSTACITPRPLTCCGN